MLCSPMSQLNHAAPSSIRLSSVPKVRRAVVARFEGRSGSMRELACQRIMEDIQTQLKEKDDKAAKEVLNWLSGDREFQDLAVELYGSGATLDEMIRILALSKNHPHGSSMGSKMRSALAQQTNERRAEIDKLCQVCAGTHGGGCSVLDLQSAIEKQFNITLSDEDMISMMEALEGTGDFSFDCSTDECASIITSVLDSPSLDDANSDAHFYHVLAQHDLRDQK